MGICIFLNGKAIPIDGCGMGEGKERLVLKRKEDQNLAENPERVKRLDRRGNVGQRGKSADPARKNRDGDQRGKRDDRNLNVDQRGKSVDPLKRNRDGDRSVDQRERNLNGVRKGRNLVVNLERNVVQNLSADPRERNPNVVQKGRRDVHQNLVVNQNVELVRKNPVAAPRAAPVNAVLNGPKNGLPSPMSPLQGLATEGKLMKGMTAVLIYQSI